MWDFRTRFQQPTALEDKASAPVIEGGKLRTGLPTESWKPGKDKCETAHREVSTDSQQMNSEKATQPQT